jgi:hydrophobic/amphiphilic exporter-1 (mainly G- bacteria), HAE1 family
MWLTTVSIRRPLLILMAVLAIMLGGSLAYRSMAVDLLPSLNIPYVGVVVVYPGAGPSEVEARVTKPIENAVAGAPGIKNLTSTSSESFSLVLLEFQDGVEADKAAQDVERRVNQVVALLPDGARRPSIQQYDPADDPVIVAGISWDRDPESLFRLVDDVVRPRIESIPGVATVQVMGGREREIQVLLDGRKLEARGLAVTHVTGALASANLSMPAGYVQEGSREYSLRVYGLHQNLEQLSNLVIASSPSGGVVRLKDVASVEDGFKKQVHVTRVNGLEGVGVLVMKQRTANTVAVSDGVAEAFAELQATLPAGVEIATVMDNARFVNESVSGLQDSLRDAVIIVAIVLLLFLHTWRSTLIVLVSIPTSLIATFGVIWALGYTINMMTMMGLALTIGILVDDSIVILENIHRHMKKGEDPFTAAYNGRREIGAAALAITLVDVVVYLPIAFLSGMVGQFFKEFGGSIVIATLFSLLVSFTLTPMLASRWLTADDEDRSPLAFVWKRWEAGYDRLAVVYRGLLDRALNRRGLVLLAGFLSFVGGIALVASGAVASEFMTEADQGMFTVSVDMPASTPLSVTNEVVASLEAGMRELPEVDSFLSIVGTGGQFGTNQARSARIYVTLNPKAHRKRHIDEVIEDVRRIGAAIPDLTLRANTFSIAGGAHQPILLSIRGKDMAVISTLASQVETAVGAIPGTMDVHSSLQTGAPEMRLQLDPDRLSDLGLTSVQVASALRTAFEGAVATELRRDNEDKVDIRVKYAWAERSDALTAIPDITLPSPSGTQVRLSQIALLVPVEGPSEINRNNRMREITVGAGIHGRPLGDVTTEIREALRAIPVPPGYQIELRGDSEMQDESFSSIGAAIGISVLLMYMLMVALYNSLVYPLVIMTALPLASVGAFGALAITGDTLNIMSMVGLIMLTGLVGKNAILVVDYTNTLRAQGYGRREALLEAGHTRLRPILMTTVSLIFAMIPMAMKFGEGAEMRAPLAIVVIGGLTTYTLLTLVVVPAAYTAMDDFQNWLGARFGRPTPEAEKLGPRLGARAGLSERGTNGSGWHPGPEMVPVRASVEK